MVFVKSTILALGLSILAAAQYGAPPSSGSSSSAAAAPIAVATGTANSAGVIDVKVGPSSQLIFDPSTVMASVGNTINFHFYAKNHSVAESSFSSPCQYEAKGIWSGFFPTSGTGANANMFSVTVKDTKPHWIYCSQTSHCSGGMVMVINPASTGTKTLTSYMAAAANANGETSGTKVEGGVSQANVAPSGSPSSSASGSAPSASGTSTTSTGAASDNTPLNWAALGGGLFLSSVWALLMA